MFTPHGKGDVKLLCLLRSVVKFRTFSSWSKPTITQSAIKSKSLAIKLPDLTKREEIFIQHQVDILSDPTCLRDVKGIQKYLLYLYHIIKSLDLFNRAWNRGFQSEDAWKNISLIKGVEKSCGVYKTGFYEGNFLVKVIDLRPFFWQIQTYYPNFKVPRRKTDHYKHHMKSPILSERIASGLRFCGVNEATLLSNPEWVSKKFSSWSNVKGSKNIF